MKLCIDTITSRVIRSFANPEIIGPGSSNNRYIDVKLDDIREFEFQFGVPFGVPTDIDTGHALTMKLGVKLPGQWSGDYAVHSDVWTKEVSAPDINYKMALDFDTDELEEALVDEDDGSDKPFIDVIAELKWTIDGVPKRTLTFIFRVHNSVNKGTEGLPSPGNPEYYTTGEVDALIAGQAAAIATKIPKKSVSITYTGTFQKPVAFSIADQMAIAPTGAGSGAPVALTMEDGPIINEFVYTELALNPVGLTTLSFDDVTGCGVFTVTASQLTALACPEMRRIFGDMQISNCAALVSLSFPELITSKAIFLSAQAALASLSFPALAAAAGGISFTSMAALAALYLPVLQQVAGAVSFSSLPVFSSLSLPALQSTDGQIVFLDCPALTTVSLPGLKRIGNTTGNSVNRSVTTTAIANFTLGGPGLKEVTGSIFLNNNGLTQASVDHILAQLVMLDGTNGTTLYTGVKTVNLSGGTSSPPSATGLAHKVILQSRGVTVTTN